MPDLSDVVDESWANSLGCPVALLRQPGAYLVPGGSDLRGYRGVYLARLDATVLVYCPSDRVGTAVAVMDALTPEEVFSPAGARHLAGRSKAPVLGPSQHSFVDAAHFRAVPDAAVTTVPLGDPGLQDLREACGEVAWSEGGFAGDGFPAYGLWESDRLLAAGNLKPYRGVAADVGVVTHPDHRGRGLARRLVSAMVADALRSSAVVRYRALTTNQPSLAVARALGFVPRGENLAVRFD